MYDVVIIGAGVTGCSIARELSKYQLKICLIEKETDVCCGTSKANSGIVHAGFDSVPGTLHAKLNIQGAALMEQYSEMLDFQFRRNGSLVLCFSDEDRPQLEELLQRGIKNGVKNLSIIEREELKALEPNVSDLAVAALYAPDGGIVCPFGLTIAMAENAAVNGVEFKFSTQVESVKKTGEDFEISTSRGRIVSKTVINAAGLYGDTLHNMVSGEKIEIIPRKGEYCLLDKSNGEVVNATVFQLPGKLGKGVLVTPTVHGNTLIGPTAEDILDKEGVDTTARGLKNLTEKAVLSIPKLPVKTVITSFAGLRAHISREKKDFMIGEVSDCPGFIDAVGIESPGLTSAPAIGLYVADIIKGKLNPAEKTDFIERRKASVDPKSLGFEEHQQLIARNHAYGNIICRCEVISEGEIIDAIRRPLGATTLDGVKRRTRSGMGRCQGGFCAPKIMEIISRETGREETELIKSGEHSLLLSDKLER